MYPDRRSKSRSRQRNEAERCHKALAADITVYGMTYSALLTAFTTKGSEYQPDANGSYIEGIKAAARLGKINTVTALVNATGGTETTFATKSKLENNLIGLGRDIHSRYLIAFTPLSESASSFHSVRIRVKTRSDAVVHARPGYWATSPDR